MVMLVTGLVAVPCFSQPKPAAPPAGNPVVGESAGTQARLQREFLEFKLALKLLEQRLDKSGKPEDKLRASSIREALKLIEEKSTDSKRTDSGPAGSSRASGLSASASSADSTTR